MRRTCAGSILTHTVGSDSGSSKCSRNTSKAAPLAAYTVGRETPEERLSPAIPPQSSCPASAFATHSIFWEVVRGVRCRLVIGCSLRLIEIGKPYHPKSTHLMASRLTSLHHRPLKSQPSIPLTQCVKQNDQSRLFRLLVLPQISSVSKDRGRRPQRQAAAERISPRLSLRSR